MEELEQEALDEKLFNLSSDSVGTAVPAGGVLKILVRLLNVVAPAMPTAPKGEIDEEAELKALEAEMGM